jgi:hypothetical protein
MICDSSVSGYQCSEWLMFVLYIILRHLTLSSLINLLDHHYMFRLDSNIFTLIVHLLLLKLWSLCGFHSVQKCIVLNVVIWYIKQTYINEIGVWVAKLARYLATLTQLIGFRAQIARSCDKVSRHLPKCVGCAPPMSV